MKHVHLAIMSYISAMLLLACSKDGVSGAEPESSSSISSSSLASSSSAVIVTITGHVVRCDGYARSIGRLTTEHGVFCPISYNGHMLENDSGIWMVGPNMGDVGPWMQDTLTLRGALSVSTDYYHWPILILESGWTMPKAVNRDSTIRGLFIPGNRSCSDTSKVIPGAYYSAYSLCHAGRHIELADTSGWPLGSTDYSHLVGDSIEVTGRMAMDYSRYRNADDRTEPREWMYLHDSCRVRIRNEPYFIFQSEGYTEADRVHFSGRIVRYDETPYYSEFYMNEPIHVMQIGETFIPVIAQGASLASWSGDSVSFDGAYYETGLLCLGLECADQVIVWNGGPIPTPIVKRDSTIHGVIRSAMQTCKDSNVTSTDKRVAKFVLCDGGRRIYIAQSDGFAMDGMNIWLDSTISLSGRYVRDSVSPNKPVREWLYVHDSVKIRLLTK